MAGFRQGGLSLKKRDNGSASDINFVSFYVDSFDRLYSVDTFGTSALVSNQWSTGCIDENIPELIKVTDQITVPELRVAIFSTSAFRGPLFRKTIPQASLTIPRDGLSKYIVADYDSGTPYFRIESDFHNVNNSNIVHLYTVWNINGDIHSILFDNKGEGLSNKIDMAICRTTPYRRSIEGGLMISVDGSRYIHISDAHVYAGTIEVEIAAYSSQTDRVTEVYHTSGNWVFPETMSGYQVDNLHYDNGTNLVVAGNNKYVCHWIYRTIGDDKEIFVRLGTAEYNNQSDAEKEQEPVSPSIVHGHGMLVGRIVIQKGASTATYQSIFDLFSSSSSGVVPNHNDLSNIQGGDSVNSEYYHLDYERASYISAVSADVQTQINDLKMLTSGTGITQVYADAHYLKLDGSNGPITSNLSIVGTLSASSVSATSIQGTTISVGNVSNTEFQRLDGISANIQPQLSTLSATKADKSIIISGTNGISGGGDLSQDRTLSLSTTGTSGTYTKVTTDQYGRVTAGTSLLASDIPSGIDASKISTGVVSNTEFNFLDGTSANIQNQLSNLSATKANNVIVSGTSGLIGGGDLLQNRYIGMPNTGTPGTYTKVTTDQYGRVTNGASLTSADIPTIPATKIGSGIINDSEFNQLDGVSANIQNQFSSLSASKIDKTAVQPFIGIYRNPETLAYQSTLLYDQVSRIVSLPSPTSAYPKNWHGSPKTISGSLGAHANATGTYFYYLDADGNLQISNDPWNILSDCPIALVYYNASQTSGICFEERHSHDRNPEAHKQQHLSTGTFCNPYPSIGNYQLAPSSPVSADNVYTLTTFTLFDEDIEMAAGPYSLTTPKQVFYQSGTSHSWTFNGYDQYGYSYGTYIQYNQFTGTTYQLTDLVNNECVNYYVFGITSLSGRNILTIPSTQKHANVSLAQAETFADVLNQASLPLQEWVLLYKITYETGNAYNTPGKCRIENVDYYTGTRSGTTLAGTGISQAFADSTYLRLDGSNDPILGDITIQANLSAINISGSSLTIGNVSNTEFSYLDGVSANIQNQLNSISNNKYTTSISILAAIGQTFTITHGLNNLRPIVKIVDETNHQEILVSPNYISTSQLSFTINSRVSRTATIIVLV